MAFKEYGNFDAVGLADLVRRKQVSATDLLDEAIARTAKVDPQINAVVVKHYDYAERQIENGLPAGPFAGVPFLLKDLDLLQGTRTTSGATLLKDFVADHSGTLAQRFLATGVAIFGKSASPEFGPPMMTGAGCCVRHQRIAPNTIGTSIKAKIPNRALNNARRSRSSISVRNKRYEMYSSHRMKVEVSRASQVQ